MKYYTIAKLTRIEQKIKKSRFIATAIPVTSKAEVEESLKHIREEFHNATHNCFAYRIGYGDKEISYYTDDGEPSQTAGPPICNSIIGHNLTNIIVIVTRYYGGTKLGTGGLIRAYGGSTSLVLESADIIEKRVKQKIKIEYNYAQINIIMHQINIFQGKILEQNYAETNLILIELNEEQTISFLQSLNNASRGQIKAQLI